MKRNLATRLAVYTILLAIFIGTLISSVTIYLNYNRTVEDLDNTATQLLELTLDSATSAVFQLDPQLADNVLSGLMQYPLFVRVSLFDDLGEELASISRPGRQFDANDGLFDQPLREYSYPLPLNADGSQTGFLVAHLDMQPGLSSFYNQALFNASSQIFMALALAILIFMVVVYLITNPLSELADSLASTEPGSETELKVSKGHGEDELGLLADSANKYLRAAQDYQRQLVTSGNRLQSILDNLHEGVLLVDAEGNIVESNKAAEDMFGYRADQLVSMPLTRLTQASQGQEFGSLLMETSKHLQSGLRCNGNRRDGKPFLIELAVSRFTAEEGNKTLWTVRDLSEQEAVERERRELEEQLRQSQKMEAIGTLAGGIAHDFNNLLAGINGYAELARVNMRKGQPAEDNIQQILRASNKAAQLVQRILTFSRKKKENRQLINIADVANDCIDLIRQAIPASIQVKADLGIANYPVFGDESMLNQVLMNLFTNAAGALKNEPGTIELRMETVAISQASNLGTDIQKQVRITVEDTGPGIPEGILPRIFEPYFTTKEPGEGTGIGLAMVHSIVDAHGGQIKAVNTGQGARFTIDLPLHEGEVSSMTEDQQQVIDGATGTGKILLVEDNEMLAEMFPELLSSIGYEVDLARDGEEGLERYIQAGDSYDLVITDQTMPRMNGDKLISKIFEINAEQPIILCTGYSDIIDREKILGMGVKCFLNKPLTLDEIRTSIEQALS